MSGPLVIAHRGASRAERENTLQAFSTAVRMNADAIELDVRLTADSQMAVHHDAGFETPEGQRLVAQSTVAELAGHIPLLAAALDACSGVLVNIEIKNIASDPDFDPDRRLAGLVVDLLVARSRRDRVLVSSFDPGTIKQVRRLDPGIDTALLTYDEDPVRALSACAEAGHLAIHPWDRKVDEQFIVAAHAMGLKVNVWTVDDPERIAELARWGVDGIVTNVPDLALATLGRA